MEAGMMKPVLILGMVGTLSGVAAWSSKEAVARPTRFVGDTVSAAALELRRLDSLATAECVQRVAERSGFQAWPEVEPVDARVVGRRWVRQADGTGRTEALKTILRVGPESVYVWARLERALLDRTVNAGAGTARQILVECPRRRTRLALPPTGT
jgi:hypothetical protein